MIAPSAGEVIIERRDLAPFATPKEMASLPRHRWFFYPHSFAPGLVEAILDHWDLPSGSPLLDPFVGAGTTLVVARDRGISAFGVDISPLSVLVSNVKAREYDPSDLHDALDGVLHAALGMGPEISNESPRLRRAFTRVELMKLISLRSAINSQPALIRDFLMVALLNTARPFSRAVANGGWFRWVSKPGRARDIVPAFKAATNLMIADVGASHPARADMIVSAELGDARTCVLSGQAFAGALTSPPYPNRHDYTRVFHIELLLMGKTEDEILELRHRSMRSHVEANDHSLPALDFPIPDELDRVLKSWPDGIDRRVPKMISGYFEDLFRTIINLQSMLGRGGRAAFVLGNVQHAGVAVPVDACFAQIAAASNMEHVGTWVVRQRGNSAQQMMTYGRNPSRESIVLLRKP